MNNRSLIRFVMIANLAVIPQFVYSATVVAGELVDTVPDNAYKNRYSDGWTRHRGFEPKKKNVRGLDCLKMPILIPLVFDGSAAGVI